MSADLNSNENKIKIAVIGLGKMGHFHLNALEALQRGEFENYYKGDSEILLSKIEICGVCDISSDRLKSISNINIFADYDDLIKKTLPDIAIIATPTQTHFDIAIAALNQGVNIFVEKPIVQTIDEFKILSDIADSKNLKIMAGHIERYNPVSVKLREILSAGTDINTTFAFTRTQQHDKRIQDDIVVDKLIHDIDLSMFFFGDIKNYEIIDYKKTDNKVCELKLNVRHKNSSGEIFVSWLTGNQTVRNIKLKQDKNLIEGDFLNKTLKVDGKYTDCKVPKWIESQNNQIKDELVDFIVHCFNKSKDLPAPLLTIKEIYNSVKIIQDISNQLR